MCGIYGYIGNEVSCSKMVHSLLKLQYRGYDSSGIAYIKSSKIKCIKDAKSASFMLQKPQTNDKTQIAIAHTRWATHGKPSKQNTHPFLDKTKQFAVVHNGIIENYEPLKISLQQKGFHFSSETDSEVLVHMFAERKENNTFQSAQEIAKMLHGSYAVAVMDANQKDQLICFKNKSPLAVGLDDGAGIVTSDITVFEQDNHSYYFLEDNEFAIVKKNSVQIFDAMGNQKQVSFQTQKMDEISHGKENYDYFMLKEIHETPEKLKLTVQSIMQELKINTNVIRTLKHKSRIFIVACGTAFHAGEWFSKLLMKRTGKNCICELASEFRYAKRTFSKTDACIFISQSGETADTIACLDLCKSFGVETIALVNVEESTIARKADFVLHTRAGKEIGVASTKAFSCQLMALECLLFAMQEKQSLKKIEQLMQETVSNFTSSLESFMKNEWFELFARTIMHEQSVYFIGRGSDYVLAKEGALKLKEISLIHAEGIASGELKHGSISLIEEDFWTVVVLTDEEMMDKSLIAASEIKARKGNVLLISPFDVSEKYYDIWIQIPNTHTTSAHYFAAAALQLIAYYTTICKGLSPDMPRNLAKSVTVE